MYRIRYIYIRKRMAPQIHKIDGIQIDMYNQEHLPPHFHAIDGEFVGLINIRTGIMFKGDLPQKKLKRVIDWLNNGDNKKKLEEKFYKLNPRLKITENEGDQNGN
jgi:hypothetical protein